MQTDTNQEIQTSILEKLVNSKQVNKTLYLHQFKNKQYDIIKSEQKWTKLFENSVLNWSKIYTNVLSATIDIKLRNFQYKFVHRIIPTNKLLFKQNISVYSICDFCSMHIETLEHLFWECNIVQVFWSNFNNRCCFFNMDFKTDLKIVCFGEYKNCVKAKAKNGVIICAKYYSFLCKCRKTIPTFLCFKLYLSSRIDIEEQIAFQQDKLEQHNLKWKMFLPLAIIRG